MQELRDSVEGLASQLGELLARLSLNDHQPLPQQPPRDGIKVPAKCCPLALLPWEGILKGIVANIGTLEKNCQWPHAHESTMRILRCLTTRHADWSIMGLCETKLRRGDAKLERLIEEVAFSKGHCWN